MQGKVYMIREIDSMSFPVDCQPNISADELPREVFIGDVEDDVYWDQAAEAGVLRHNPFCPYCYRGKTDADDEGYAWGSH